MVIWKNCFRLTRIVPAHEADAEQHREADAEQPAEQLENAGSIEPQRAQSMSTVSTPSRKIIRKTKRKTPQRAAALPGVLLQPSFNFAFQLAAVAVHPDHHAKAQKRR